MFNDPWAREIDLWRNIGGNLLLFAPFGFLLPLLLPLNAVRTFGYALPASLGIELMQVLVAYLGGSWRIGSGDEVLLNGLGALAGYGGYWLLRRMAGEPRLARLGFS